MSSFWPKIITLAIIVAVLVAVVKFLPESKKEEPQPSLSETFRKDDERLRAKPEPVEQPQQESQVQPEEQPEQQPQQVEAPESILDEPAQPEQVEGQPEPLRQLSEIENIEAERLFEQAETFRKTARVQTGFKPMVDICRQIMAKFPGTEWDIKARRLLNEIPERYYERYKITEEELDMRGYE